MHVCVLAAHRLRVARPGESIADLIFIFVFARITKAVRSILDLSEYCLRLPLASVGILSAQLSLDSTTNGTEAVYVDDAMHYFLHPDPVLIANAIGFTAAVF